MSTEETTCVYGIYCVIKIMPFKLRPLNNLILLVSCISKNEFALDLKKLRIVTLNLLIDSIFLILSLSLLHSLIQYGKNEFSNTLVLALIGLILFCVVELVTLFHKKHYDKFEDKIVRVPV